jgi:hypothetical protein
MQKLLLHKISTVYYSENHHTNPQQSNSTASIGALMHFIGLALQAASPGTFGRNLNISCITRKLQKFIRRDFTAP